jgi:hypothetical protein
MERHQSSVLEFQTKFLQEFISVRSSFAGFQRSMRFRLLPSGLRTVVSDLAGSKFSARKEEFRVKQVTVWVNI